MASRIRTLLTEKMVEGLRKHGSAHAQTCDNLTDLVEWGWRFPAVNKKTKSVQMDLSFKYLKANQLLPDVKWAELKVLGNDFTEAMQFDGTIKRISPSPKGFVAEIDQHNFCKTVLTAVFDEKSTYGFNSRLHLHKSTKEGALKSVKQQQKVLVEFSSPNIAKPFHAGHLRSTVLGHSLTCLYKALGHDVTRINFLGDWGTQFGYLGVGFEKFGSLEKLAESPMQHLFDIYVKANKEADENSDFHARAMNFFAQMEAGDAKCLDFWKQCHDRSVDEFKEMYKRLGVEFDVYEGESHYQEDSRQLVQQLEERNLLHTREDTGQKYLDLSGVAACKDDPQQVVVQKSDGSSLYVTRDIAAFNSRRERYDFDRMHYVVDTSQKYHFQQLLLTCQLLTGHTYDLSDFHIAFGRVQGMRTRKGQVVFLADLLDEAIHRMKYTMERTETTKVHDYLVIDETARTLAISGLVVMNLKDQRLKGYEFNWDRILTMKGDSGPYLQYQHARLCSIIRNAKQARHLEPDSRGVFFDLLADDPRSMGLVIQIAMFDEAVSSAFAKLEPHIIAQYAFSLCHLTTKVIRDLSVKDSKTDLAKARLLLFDCVRQTLSNSLQLLGITGLEKM